MERVYRDSEKRNNRPCQFTDFKSRNYPLKTQEVTIYNFRVGTNQLPLLRISKEESRGCIRPGSNLLPENFGYVTTCGYALQGYISNRTFKQPIAALCFGNGYFRGTPDKRMRGQQADSFCNHITINVCLALESCCQMCYIKHRKRESHRSGSTPQTTKLKPLMR